MRQAALVGMVAVGIVAAGGVGVWAQDATAPPKPVAAPAGAHGVAGPASQTANGGRLHGVVKSGTIPLPGVTVTAQNTLTGKKYSTTTDITGSWSMNLPQNGRYVIRTQFTAFAVGSEEALLNATSREQTVNFALVLASRAAAEEQRAGEAANEQTAGSVIQELTGNGAGSVSLMSALSADTDTGNATAGASGAELPSVASNSDFGGDSVVISGQSGQVSPLAGVDIDRIRDAIAAYRAANPGQQLPGGGGLFGGGGGGFGGGGFGGVGRGFGGGGGGFGGRGGGRGNFRGFNPGQPHGAVFWMGSNSDLNAQPFALLGQSQSQPASGTNRFGLTFMSAPYLPGLTKPSGKDTVFLTLSGSRSSSPEDFYATVPTFAERGGDFSAAGLPAIYDPVTQQQFSYNGTQNVIPPASIAAQASALLNYIPQPNLTGSNVVGNYNYHLLTTSQSNTTQAGVRYMRSLGANATQPGGGRGGFGGGRRSRQNQGLRQSINFNYNWSHSASDHVNFVPQLGGRSASESNAVQAGYTVGYHKVTSIFIVSWNRSNSNTTNFFTNTSNDVAHAAGITLPNDLPLNYGLPSISLSQLSGLSQTQPSFSIAQTISASEVLSWIHGKHNMRYGGDYRRVHRDFLAGSNATGNFTFTGLFTEDAAGDAATGSSAADFLLGLPQSTTLNSSLQKSYLRDNVVDAFAMDDWRVKSSLTVNYGVRYEFYVPYSEKYDHLAYVATNPEGGFTTLTQVTAGTSGYPGSLVAPWRKAFRPSMGIAWRVPKVKQTVVRAGFGMNYTVGEYATFATQMAHQPPFTNQQTNQAASGNSASSACARTVPMTCFTLANGFPAPATLGNFALDPHYPLPYVQAWNLDIQKTLPSGVVLNIGYNGSRGNHLDTVIAPRSIPSSPGTDPSICNGSLGCYPLNFTYEKAVSFSKFNAGTVRVNKRLSGGFAVGANYQYSHSIDDAGALGGVGGVGVQNWQDVLGELGNSSLDVRHSVSGNYLYELPFGKDKYWVTTGKGAHILEGFSVSGSFRFATGTWLSPSYQASVTSTTCGTGGVMRPNLTGASVMAGGGSLQQWFNPAAYAAPTNTTGYCDFFGNAPRNSILGPGTVSNNMSLSKTMQMGDTRSMEIRAEMNNAFNTVQYAGVGTVVNGPKFGQVTSTGQMRQFQFTARYRF
ncbi:MAG TPA: carboxypeptidase-like regulatory domain-containing protein [Terracidiphilus sp.]|nr:carboxypeptidase-like regulatory domain-containing protein [Terracidiphilus sp.]